MQLSCCIWKLYHNVRTLHVLFALIQHKVEQCIISLEHAFHCKSHLLVDSDGIVGKDMHAEF